MENYLIVGHKILQCRMYNILIYACKHSVLFTRSFSDNHQTESALCTVHCALCIVHNAQYTIHNTQELYVTMQQLSSVHRRQVHCGMLLSTFRALCNRRQLCAQFDKLFIHEFVFWCSYGSSEFLFSLFPSHRVKGSIR